MKKVYQRGLTRLGVAGSEQRACVRSQCCSASIHFIYGSFRDLICLHFLRRTTYDIRRCIHDRHRLRTCSILYFIGFDRVALSGGQEYLLRAACPLPLPIRDLTVGFGHCQSSLLRLSIPLAVGTSSAGDSAVDSPLGRCKGCASGWNLADTGCAAGHSYAVSLSLQCGVQSAAGT
ncbi:uncharacterized protein [Drosophila pseudoobscura]|uniref:Uncharacterized protein isoform X2 n=1 Tax=Drosophila pseudoobscura pseudoobscura TaxID=46245 RepID=A0A6I8VZT5_DROPS|nr:uncharacterized protein LOC117184182 isoform X2 [Drosophila pseudoobscura]